ncbi:MAG TPA: RNA chaperone Hfq [Bryobacteraceae bacterium]|nr:RNA chaperone Hfq [Bryobacteraceae bacterium]
MLETNNQEQLIFKHAISTVVVSKPFHTSAGGHSSGTSASAAAAHPAPAEPIED